VYLKSLSLKGFKSFADKSTMTFDPGLNVIVGPNGSGKSNVSDAILWVLGEQSAKMLRGQAMEDVIFSGSSARQPVSVAEVMLVLDNSDGTLPVDYSEVAITRRMYRSGENEYLINGSTSRLMDITDILHDSGLGKETHSIISQGKLDSVLSSRPEQRRELIEEAADIAKHRRRKERSNKKLESMDKNLTRAKDIEREIKRQLRPLERQAEKARRAHELEDRLRQLQTQLAVDDLRGLQARHADLASRGREAGASIELAQLRLREKGDALERYQATLEEKGLFVGDLAEQRQRVAGQLSRLEADARLASEKGRNMDARIGDLARTVQTAERDRAQAEAELAQVASDLAAARGEWDALKREVDGLATAAKAATARRRELGSRVAQLQADQRTAQRTADQETVAYAKLRDQIGNAEVEDQMYQSRLAQIQESLSACEDRLRERTARKEAISRELAEAQGRADSARERIGALQDGARASRGEESRARDRLSQQRATLSALRSVDAQAQASSPLVAAVTKRRDVADLVQCRLADLIEAPEDLEPLVERLLGEDLNALVVRDADAVAHVAAEAAGVRKASGRATVVSYAAAPAGVPAEAPGHSLLAKLRVVPGAEGLVGALMGDVRLVASVAEAVRAHEQVPACTYVTPDGVTVLPDGRTVIGASSDAERGALERKRRIRALDEAMPSLQEALDAASAAVAQAEAALNATREANASARGDVARLRGELSSVTAEVGRLEGERSKSLSEQAQVQKGRDAARQKAASARAEIDRHRQASADASARADQLSDELQRAQDERGEASHEESEADRRLSDARLRLATVQERKNHLITREDELGSRAKRLRSQGSGASDALASLRAKRRRVAPLEARYQALRDRLAEWSARLADRASLAEADSNELKRTITEARSAVNEASQDLERARTVASDVKVEQGKIEVQVQHAVSAIEEAGANLEEALALPAPDDREAAEAEVQDLKAALRGIGPVNEVATDQYARLKERADYISEQVEDLEGARKALKRIDDAIERKMRRQFLVTFDAVNANFQEVFGLLFPGGAAHLEMTDPDHPTETGIEIVAQPRGKRIQKMSLMSGGEKSLTALALLFAVYRTRTVPFYVFDEVEAALDYSNLQRLLDAIEQLKKTTQLLVITHQRRTMEQADVLYGVSMQADGVSHVVSQRLDQTGKVVAA